GDEHVADGYARRVADLDDQLPVRVEATARRDVFAWIGGQVEPHGRVLGGLSGRALRLRGLRVVLERRGPIAALLGERAKRVVRIGRRQQPRARLEVDARLVPLAQLAMRQPFTQVVVEETV